MLARPKKVEGGFTYRDAGVDIDAGNAFVKAITPLADSTHRVGSLASLGAFGGIFDLKATGYKDPLLVASTDGVGTKIKIALETRKYDTIGIDLVAMCVNDVIVQGAEPLFLLDYIACNKLELSIAVPIVEGIAAGCREAGVELIGGETAEMPGVYAPGDYDLAGCAVGAVERPDLLPKKTLRAGDIVIGLRSSGIHSNGFSFVRRLVNDLRLDWNEPAPFDSERALGAALLEPTRIYVKPLLATIRRTNAVKAAAHITGSGHIEKIPRVLPEGLTATIDTGSWPIPPVFKWLRDNSRESQDEFLRVFNCGIGMVIITAENDAERVVKALEDVGEQPVKIGYVETDPLGTRKTRVTGRLKF